jgi:hypothetical protein
MAKQDKEMSRIQECPTCKGTGHVESKDETLATANAVRVAEGLHGRACHLASRRLCLAAVGRAQGRPGGPMGAAGGAASPIPLILHA